MTAPAGGDREGLRQGLLLATLPHVAFDGWSAAALAAGARDSGLDDVEIARLFPGGGGELLRCFAAWADQRMVAALQAADLDSMGVRERMALALRARLDAVAPWPEAVRRALVRLALPVNAPLALHLTWRTVDTIWYAAGDRSADFSFYSKRAILAGVYAATVLYWLDDKSEDRADTWAFLDRRLADAVRLGGLRQLAGRLPNPFRLLAAAMQRPRY